MHFQNLNSNSNSTKSFAIQITKPTINACNQTAVSICVHAHWSHDAASSVSPRPRPLLCLPRLGPPRHPLCFASIPSLYVVVARLERIAPSSSFPCSATTPSTRSLSSELFAICSRHFVFHHPIGVYPHLIAFSRHRLPESNPNSPPLSDCCCRWLYRRWWAWAPTIINPTVVSLCSVLPRAHLPLAGIPSPPSAFSSNRCCLPLAHHCAASSAPSPPSAP